MRKATQVFLSLAVALTLVGITGSTAQAQEHKKKGEPISLTNAQVIDLHCYTANGVKGDAHKECAKACANAGVPLAILASDGKVYVPVASGPMQSQEKFTKQLQAHAEGFVNVKGTLFQRSGVLGIEIEEVESAKS